MTNTPHLAITKPEGDKLGKAITDVAAQYNHVVSPKAAAWIQLCIVSGGIYGTRIAAARLDSKTEAKKRAAKVVELKPNETGPSPANGFPIPDEAAMNRPGEL